MLIKHNALYDTFSHLETTALEYAGSKLQMQNCNLVETLKSIIEILTEKTILVFIKNQQSSTRTLINANILRTKRTLMML
jgi:hypothetical protein